MDTKKRLIYLILGPVLFAIAALGLKGALGDAQGRPRKAGRLRRFRWNIGLDGILVGNTASCTDGYSVPSCRY